VTTFGDRGRAFEDKYAHDEQLEFKARVKRDHLFGAWIADEIGMQGITRDTFIREYAAMDLTKPGDHSILDKAYGALVSHRKEVSMHRLEGRLAELMVEARMIVVSEA